ncbi:hypothetical protein D3C73_1260710 [compost metagenome]
MDRDILLITADGKGNMIGQRDMNMLIERLAAALHNMQHNFLDNLNQLLIHLGNELLILFLLLLVAENEHLLHRGQINHVTALAVIPDPLTDHDYFGILGMLGNDHIVIEYLGHGYAAQLLHLF